MKKSFFSGIFLFTLLLPSLAAAAGSGNQGFFSVGTAVLLLKLTALFVVLITLIVIPLKSHLNEAAKKIIFWLLVITTVGSTVFFAGTIVYENAISVTKGPIHWHADYQVWVCGERQDMIDPKFPKNKIGSPLFHEHNDDRIHVEGTVDALANVDLGSFFEVVGGVLEDGHFAYDTINGRLDVQDGDSCPDGTTGTLKVYANGEKLDDYANYLYYPHAYVPPGDCIMIVFDDTTADSTDEICDSWAAQEWNYRDFERDEVTIGGHT